MRRGQGARGWRGLASPRGRAARATRRYRQHGRARRRGQSIGSSRRGPDGHGAQAEKPAKAPAPTTGGGGGDAALIALGDSIFHGQAAGGTCYACHGQDAKGSAVGPNLTDAEWLHSDGSLAAITKTIQTGVPTPKKAPAPMPPMGGASLSPDQVRAAAAYVHSLSKGGGKA